MASRLEEWFKGQRCQCEQEHPSRRAAFCVGPEDEGLGAVWGHQK
jgi:hypothetical protein